MPEKQTNPFTTARPIGTVLRDIMVALGALIAILGALGFLSDVQVASIKQHIEVISGQAPALVMAFGVILTAVTSIWRTVKFASSDRAAEVAQQIDKVLPPGETARVVTPPGTPDIPVPAEKK